MVSITADCDGDALVVMVEKDGPACHLGTDSCFGDPIWEGEEAPGFRYEALMDMLRGRKENPKEGSYTTYLFQKGRDKIFSLDIQSFSSANWMSLALMTVGGLAVLLLARLAVRPFLRKLDQTKNSGHQA